MGAHKNFIAGEWVDGSTVTRDINPSDTNDLVGEYAQADAAQTERRDRGRACGLSRLVAHHAAGAPRHPAARFDRDPRPPRGARAPALARGGQDAAGRDRRGDPGRPDLRLLRRRSVADSGREIRERATRTSTSRSRASRSASSASSRRGTSRSRSPPGRSPRRWPTATRSCSSPPTSSPARPMRCPKSSCAPACPRACSISWSGAARWSARRSSTTGKSTRSPSQARSRPAPRSRPPAPRPCAGSSSRWAARIRWSCSPTPTSRPRSNARSTAPISRPASAARPRRASSSRSRSTDASPTRSPSGCARSSSTTR